MIGRLMGGVTPWLLALLIGLSVFLYQQTQQVTAERDAALVNAEHAEERAAILREHQQWQQQQIQVLNDALAERDQALAIIADDISANKAALQQLGETDGEARDWLDSDMPGVVTDWVRQLQQPDAGGVVRLPNSSQASDE